MTRSRGRDPKKLYEQAWAHRFAGERALQWELVHWDDNKPGDTIHFFDVAGRFCSRVVDRRGRDTVVTQATNYAGSPVLPETCVVRLSPKLRGNGAPCFRYAERWIGGKKLRRYIPLT